MSSRDPHQIEATNNWFWIDGSTSTASRIVNQTCHACHQGFERKSEVKVRKLI